MRSFAPLLAIGLMILTLGSASSAPLVLSQESVATKAPASAATDISEKELSTSIPALARLREVIRPLWHNAYPAKNYAMIKDLLPRADTLVAELDKATLPGILRDKQGIWEGGKEDLKWVLGNLHAAANAEDQEKMLKQVEAFHAAFERLVRAVRPVVPELEAFHQELYKLYHYYTPLYDLENIRAASSAMTEKMAALKAAQLPKRLADRQEKFQAAVLKLEIAVDELSATVKTNARKEIEAAVQKVHDAYKETEQLFD